MKEPRLPGFLLSIILHLGLCALVLFWPAAVPPPPPAPGLMVSGYVTLGKEGRTATDTKDSQARPGAPSETVTEGEPVPQKAKPSEPEMVKEQPPVEPEKKPQEPAKSDPDAAKIPVKKEKEKEPEQKRPEPTEKKEEKKEEKKQEKPKETTPAKEAPKEAAKAKDTVKKESVKEALNDLAKENKKDKKTQSGGSGSGNALKDALGDLKKQSGGMGNDAEGSGPGGQGGTGIGAVTQAYMEVVAASIKQNWAMTGRADRKNMSATVRITIAADGSFEKYEIIRSSGDRYFDSTLLTAIGHTRQAPERPPTQQDKVFDINFYP